MRLYLLVLGIAAAAVAASVVATFAPSGSHAARPKSATGIHKIKHVIVIMQENRSFDHYFGTFPGADGIPGVAGNPGKKPCLQDPLSNPCTMPFHDRNDVNFGGPHGEVNATADMDCRKLASRSRCK